MCSDTVTSSFPIIETEGSVTSEVMGLSVPGVISSSCEETCSSEVGVTETKVSVSPVASPNVTLSITDGFELSISVVWLPVLSPSVKVKAELGVDFGISDGPVSCDAVVVLGISVLNREKAVLSLSSVSKKAEDVSNVKAGDSVL